MQRVSFTVSSKMSGWRLDKALRQQYPAWGRSAVKSILNKRQVRVNGKQVWLGSWKVNKGDQIEINNPPAEKPKPIAKFQEDWIIADMDSIIAINKPAGLRTHATRAGGTDNLLDLARAHFGDIAAAHRLDRDTSGVILLTRPHPATRAHLDQLFKSNTIQKTYLAVVNANNDLAPSGEITASLAPDPKRKDKIVVVQRGGQRAITQYKILAEAEGKQLIQLHPQTGRMHQLRVHLAHFRAPILGDRLYGDKSSAPRNASSVRRHASSVRLLLHAHHLTLPDKGFQPLAPANSHQTTISFVAPLGTDFRKTLPREFEKHFD